MRTLITRVSNFSVLYERHMYGVLLRHQFEFNLKRNLGITHLRTDPSAAISWRICNDFSYSEALYLFNTRAANDIVDSRASGYIRTTCCTR